MQARATPISPVEVRLSKLNETGAKTMEDGLTEEQAEIRDVHAYFGRAMHSASCVETGLTIALMQAELMAQTYGRSKRERKAPTREQWEAMFDHYMAQQEQLTLGVLIPRIRSVLKLGGQVYGLLDESLKRRNFLVHVFFRDNAAEWSHHAGRQGMIDQLDKDNDLFEATDQAVQAAVAPVLAKIGIDADKMKAEVERIMEREIETSRARTAAGEVSA